MPDAHYGLVEGYGGFAYGWNWTGFAGEAEPPGWAAHSAGIHSNFAFLGTLSSVFQDLSGFEPGVAYTLSFQIAAGGDCPPEICFDYAQVLEKNQHLRVTLDNQVLIPDLNPTDVH